MTSIAARTAALQLARHERADLARQLIASLDESDDGADEGVEAAWLAEAARALKKVYYVIRDDQIRVYAFGHTSRKPGYWRARLRK